MHISPLKKAILIMISLTGVLGFSFAARGAEVGSAAWVITDSVLRSGPGSNYPETSRTLNNGDSVTVARCSRQWCRIADTSGWISMNSLNFGTRAVTPFFSSSSTTSSDADAQVCLFSGEQFTGTSICLNPGATVTDLSLSNFDNTIASVSIEGDTYVDLCRDANLSSYCVRYTQSAERLDRLLSNAVSSYRVY